LEECKINLYIALDVIFWQLHYISKRRQRDGNAEWNNTAALKS
jgi:hypothetical protein